MPRLLIIYWLLSRFDVSQTIDGSTVFISYSLKLCYIKDSLSVSPFRINSELNLEWFQLKSRSVIARQQFNKCLSLYMKMINGQL